jgi:hypothetical protein
VIRGVVVQQRAARTTTAAHASEDARHAQISMHTFSHDKVGQTRVTDVDYSFLIYICDMISIGPSRPSILLHWIATQVTTPRIRDLRQ